MRWACGTVRSLQIIKQVLSAGVVLPRGEDFHSQCGGRTGRAGRLWFVGAGNGLRAAACGAYGFLPPGEFLFVLLAWLDFYWALLCRLFSAFSLTFRVGTSFLIG